MGRTKGSGGGGPPSGSSFSPAPDSASNGSNAAADRIKDLLKELYNLIHEIQVIVQLNTWMYLLKSMCEI